MDIEEKLGERLVLEVGVFVKKQAESTPASPSRREKYQPLDSRLATKKQIMASVVL
jgi:hypothetical protein